MPVRKTESRLPSGLSIGDLGQTATAATNPNIHLVSYLSAPIVRERMHHYVVLVTDATLAATVGQYEWSITDGGTPHTQNTDIGLLEYTPQNLGSLSISVNVKNVGGASIATVALQQDVVPLFVELERLIDEREDNISSVPRAAHPETSRELINDLRRYADAVAPPATENLMDRLLLSICYAATQQIPAASQIVRNQRLETVARSLNVGPGNDFHRNTLEGIGVCKLRPYLLAMCLNKGTTTSPYIPFTQVPTGRARTATMAVIATDFNALSEEDMIDLFNLLRFPKTHFRVCKVVFERLRTEYYASDTTAAVLGDTAKTVALIGHYQESGIARDVRSLMQHNIWTIVPPIPGAGGSSTNPAAPGPATQPNIGSFERIPPVGHTFISTHDHNGFINEAFAYHETYGLGPIMVPSLERILELLAAATTPLERIRIVTHFGLAEGSGSGTSFPLNGMLVKFFTAQTNDFTEWWHFKFGISDEEGLRCYFEDRLVRPSGYRIKSDIQIAVNNASTPLQAPTWQACIMAVRTKMAALPAANNVLTPFGLGAAGSSVATGDLRDFIRYSADLFLLQSIVSNVTLDADSPSAVNIPAPASVLATITTFINVKLTEIVGRLHNATRTDTAFNNLKTAIATLTLNDLPVVFTKFTLPFDVEDSGLLQSFSGFRTRLQTVRSRFSATSFVDIRGCRIGQDPTYITELTRVFGRDANYMQAVRDFFASSSTIKPSVTAPEWFQSFSPSGSITSTLVNDQTFASRGFVGPRSVVLMPAADVQRAYATWSGRIGIPAHIAFWSRLSADALEFLTFSWKTQIPGLALNAVRLRDLVTLNAMDTITRLGTIFAIPAGSMPAPAPLQALLPQIGFLQKINQLVFALDISTLPERVTSLTAIATLMGQTLPAAPTPLTQDYVLQAHNQLIRALATSMSQTLPAAPTPLIEEHLIQSLNQLIQAWASTMSQTLPAAPAPATLVYIKDSRDRLLTFARSGIAPFLTALQAALTPASAGFVYMLNIGLPLLAQQAGHEDNTTFIFLRPLGADAMRSFMNVHWADTLPAGNTVNTLNPNFDDTMTTGSGTGLVVTDYGRVMQTPRLSNFRDTGEAPRVADFHEATNPDYEYQLHIKSIP